MSGRIARVLRPWEEVVGVLNNLTTNNGKLILSISLSINLEIPNHSVNKETLEKALGHRVGILRTDSGYLVRDFKTSNVDYILLMTENRNPSTIISLKRSVGKVMSKQLGPDLKQFLKQKKSEGNATKTPKALLQSHYFSLFQKIVAVFGPIGLLHSLKIGSGG